MKLFLSQLLLFVVLVLCSLCAIGYIKGAPESPSELYNQKVENAIGADLLLTGSSHTYRQLVPAVFKEGMADYWHVDEAVNIGVPGNFPLENLYLVKNLPPEVMRTARVVMFQLGAVSHIADDNSGAMRSIYHVDNDALSLTYRLYGLDDRFKNYLHSWILRKLMINNVFFTTISKTDIPYDHHIDGYLSLEQQYDLLKQSFLGKRNRDYRNNSTKILNKIKQRGRRNLYRGEKFILDEYVELSQKYPHVRFIAYVNVTDHVKTTKYQGINILSVPDHVRDDLLSDPANFYDKGHLSEQGAMKFSASLVERLNNISTSD